ncbi:malto-oligosyltrehalose trehalohydrolase [Bosea sp. PAMC 26642]|uniref:malto-oligosyltrehalose trehalohydrolase n=1 Tax=Bosea sp. (strain PAMC 26642) TaxID=1792307 RepID=UPI0007702129|nr:malto-oligosyltrehalose trehalohydrolase [Bosea sp. PAMC 26642]AMJ59794.1 malto-oligosyltrehalose trehalohydrolase [Bosea sp. PAMC 26642]
MHRAYKMPFSAELSDDGTRFALWAPSADKVSLVLDDREDDMIPEDRGWYRLDVPGAGAGTRYLFRIDGGLHVPDPASRFQPEDVSGPSIVVDPLAFAWSDGGWKGRPWEETVLYEAHVGTATPKGTFAGLAEKLEYLSDLGITALELLPIADFPGSRNWGYDGVLHYAPDHAYGTPDDLKALVDAAHHRGMMVFLDVVYNHFGPSGNYLPAYAKTFFTDRHETLWGAGINFDGDAADTVRDYFIHNSLYWLEEYHFDGLRFDAVHAIADDSEKHFIAELGERIRVHLPDRHIHLVLENNANQARWLERDDDHAPRLHSAQWNDDIHHAWHRLLTGEADGYYGDYDDPAAHLGRCLAEGFAYQGEISRHDNMARGEPSTHLPPTAFVAFLQNHDQVGNRAFGDRIGALTTPEKMELARAGLLLSPQIPLLFMGEEWQASAPFQYFVDFADLDLSEAVRNGRRREFAGFGIFQDESAHDMLPDPTASQTFAQSCLDWDEIERSPHSEALAETRALLRLRREIIAPLTASGFSGARWERPAPEAIEVQWDFLMGSLRFIANFGEDEVRLSGGSAGTRTIWASQTIEASSDIVLRPWTGAMLVRAS